MKNKEPERYGMRPRPPVPFEGQPIPPRPRTWEDTVTDILAGASLIAAGIAVLIIIARIVAGILNIPIFPDQIG